MGKKDLEGKLGIFGVDKISRGGKIYAEDYYCVDCYSKEKEVQAEALWPVFDLDQETVPRPYCRDCIDKRKIEMIIYLQENKE